MADFNVKSAIPSIEWGFIPVNKYSGAGGCAFEMAELLMKSAKVELGTYAHPLAASLLFALRTD